MSGVVCTGWVVSGEVRQVAPGMVALGVARQGTVSWRMVRQVEERRVERWPGDQGVLRKGRHSK